MASGGKALVAEGRRDGAGAPWRSRRAALSVATGLALLLGAATACGGGDNSTISSAETIAARPTATLAPGVTITPLPVSETVYRNQIAAPVSYTHLDVYKRQRTGGPSRLLAHESPGAGATNSSRRNSPPGTVANAIYQEPHDKGRRE